MIRLLQLLVKAKYGLLALGLLVFAFSWTFKPATPDCGGQKMRPGTVCRFEARGEVKTYEEMVEEENTTMLAGRWGGLAVAAAGIVLIVHRRRTVAHLPAPPSALPAPPAARPDPPAVAAPWAQAQAQVSASAVHPRSGWFPDPAGVHQVRWFDGTAWTARAATNGVEVIDQRPGVTAW